MTLSAVTLYETAPGASKLIPGASKKAKQFETGMAWALEHPKETLERIGKDTISYKLWAEGHYAEAVGHNVVAFASIFIAASQLGKTSRAVHVAAKTERASATVAGIERATVHAVVRDASSIRPGAGTNPESSAARIELATARHHVAEGQHAVARRALEESRAAHQQALDVAKHRPGVGDAVKVGQAGTAVTDDDQKAQKP